LPSIQFLSSLLVLQDTEDEVLNIKNSMLHLSLNLEALYKITVLVEEVDKVMEIFLTICAGFFARNNINLGCLMWLE